MQGSSSDLWQRVLTLSFLLHTDKERRKETRTGWKRTSILLSREENSVAKSGIFLRHDNSDRAPRSQPKRRGNNDFSSAHISSCLATSSAFCSALPEATFTKKSFEFLRMVNFLLASKSFLAVAALSVILTGISSSGLVENRSNRLFKPVISSWHFAHSIVCTERESSNTTLAFITKLFKHNLKPTFV